MVEKPPVLFINSPYPTALQRLNEHFTVYNYRDAPDKAALVAEAAKHVHAIFTNGSAWIPSLLDALPKLEIIACSSTGYDEFDMPALRRRGIRLCHSTGMSEKDVPDLGMALMLAAARRITWAERYVRSGEWMVKGRAPTTTRVCGKKLGIIGLGSIGRGIAKRATGFDMDISYHGPNRKTDVPYRYYANLVEMAQDVDFLLMACIGGPTTAGIANAEVFKALGPKGIFVNIGRGSCVDQNALLAALRSGGIAGAGLDVYAQEPQDPKPFEGLDNVVLTPHYANGTPDTRHDMFNVAIDNLLAFFAGRPLLTPVPETPN